MLNNSYKTMRITLQNYRYMNTCADSGSTPRNGGTLLCHGMQGEVPVLLFNASREFGVPTERDRVIVHVPVCWEECKDPEEE
jgi:hypothetical protein